MKKINALLIVTVFVALLLVPLVRADWGPEEWKKYIIKQEEMDKKIYLNEYEAIPEGDNLTLWFGERMNGDKYYLAPDYIRPDEVQGLVRSLNIPQQAGVGEIVDIVYSWVLENIKFTPEEGMMLDDYWQFPAETVRIGQGDCEDTANLLASMLIAAGVPENLIRVNTKNFHCYTTVRVEGKEKILETDFNPDSYYLYDWPLYRWNREIAEQRKKIKTK